MSFPSTPILDNFNRSVEDPLSGGGNWSTVPLISGGQTSTLSGNQVVANQTTGVTNNCGQWWKATLFGPDVEVYADIPSFVSTMASNVACRTRNENDGSLCTLYKCGFDGANHVLVSKFILTVNTQLLSTTVATQTNGNKIGMSVVGSTITGWYQQGGAWTSVAPVTDTTIASAGHIGFFCGTNATNNSIGILDNFGGGTVIPFQPEEDSYSIPIFAKTPSLVRMW